MKRLLLAALTALLVGVVAIPATALASDFSGQVTFGQVAAEPAFDGTTGQQIFLLLPDKAATEPTAAWSPLYLIMYPTNSTLGTLDCTPNNCPHVNVLDPNLVSSLGLGSVYPTGTISTNFGTFTGGLVKGHDHLTGVDANGQAHVTRHVFLVLFTGQGVADGAVNTEITTLNAMNAAIGNGDAVAPIDTGLIIHAEVTTSATYLNRN